MPFEILACVLLFFANAYDFYFAVYSFSEDGQSKGLSPLLSSGDITVEMSCAIDPRAVWQAWKRSCILQSNEISPGKVS